MKEVSALYRRAAGDRSVPRRPARRQSRARARLPETLENQQFSGWRQNTSATGAGLFSCTNLTRFLEWMTPLVTRSEAERNEA